MAGESSHCCYGNQTERRQNREMFTILARGWRLQALWSIHHIPAGTGYFRRLHYQAYSGGGE